MRHVAERNDQTLTLSPFFGAYASMLYFSWISLANSLQCSPCAVMTCFGFSVSMILKRPSLPACADNSNCCRSQWTWNFSSAFWKTLVWIRFLPGDSSTRKPVKSTLLRCLFCINRK